MDTIAAMPPFALGLSSVGLLLLACGVGLAVGVGIGKLIEKLVKKLADRQRLRDEEHERAVLWILSHLRQFVEDQTEDGHEGQHDGTRE